MARVRLQSGGATPSQVRLSIRGASERLRAPADDVNGPDSSADAACGWCGSRRKVDVSSRRRRCRACLADEAILAQVAATLAAAGQPPLGSRTPDGAAYSKQRKLGQAARQRLKERKAAAPRKKAAPTVPRKAAQEQPAPRRTSAQEKQHARRRLVVKITELERAVDERGLPVPRKTELEEDLRLARSLLRRWDDDVH